MTPEQKAHRLQLIKESHQRVQQKIKALAEFEDEKELDPPDLVEEIETIFTGDKDND